MLDVAGRNSIYMNGLGLADTLSLSSSTQRQPNDLNLSFSVSEMEDVPVHFVEGLSDNAVVSFAGKRQKIILNCMTSFKDDPLALTSFA